MGKSFSPFNIDSYLKVSSEKSLLRFTTAGSVDDGKSTLIGRMLYDSKTLFEDHLSAIKKNPDNIDFAHLTDGLKAEREQGITIDVAYRYFSTPGRNYILADTPGHEQYTRNMATGASTADLAIILIDARKGVITQTKRHSFICSLLRISNFIIAINKMDLVDYSEAVFNKIKSEYQDFSATLDLHQIKFIPVSALFGDNIVTKSNKMPWYAGESILESLDNTFIGSGHNLLDFRFPVQLVSRPHHNFRGFCGQIASGRIKVGDKIVILPSMIKSAVQSIETFDGPLAEAFAPMSVTLTLDDEIDIGRGDMIVKKNNLPLSTNYFEAMLVWISNTPMVANSSYLLKHTSNSTKAVVGHLSYTIDINTLSRNLTPHLCMNEIGRVTISTHEKIFIDTYKTNRQTGSFILIDLLSNNTVAAGMIIEKIPQEDLFKRYKQIDIDAAQKVREIHPSERLVSKSAYEIKLKQQGKTLWFTGLSGAGKSTIGRLLEKKFFDEDRFAILLDGDNIRAHLNSDLGFSDADRSENIRRVAEVAKLFNSMGMIVITAFISPFAKDRLKAQEIIGADNFYEIYIDTPIDLCQKRDPKGLYKKAINGTIKEFTGISSSYEHPESPSFICSTQNCRPEESAMSIFQFYLEKL